MSAREGRRLPTLLPWTFRGRPGRVSLGGLLSSKARLRFAGQGENRSSVGVRQGRLAGGSRGERGEIGLHLAALPGLAQFLPPAFPDDFGAGFLRIPERTAGLRSRGAPREEGCSLMNA